MTAGPEPRTSRVLPVAVAALFALVLLADLAALALYAHDPSRFEDDRLEIVFSSRAAADGGAAEELPLPDHGVLSGGDGRVLAERAGGSVVVRAEGELVIRLVVPEAGAVLELDYRFLDPADRGRCEIAVGRVVSRHGVDVVRRARLAAVKRAQGTFRHDLADHVGPLELRLEVNRAAARDGLEVMMPRGVPG